MGFSFISSGISLFSYKPSTTKVLNNSRAVRLMVKVVKELLLMASRAKFFLKMLLLVICSSIDFFLKK